MNKMRSGICFERVHNHSNSFYCILSLSVFFCKDSPVKKEEKNEQIMKGKFYISV